MDKEDIIDLAYVILIGIACPFALLIDGVIPNQHKEQKVGDKNDA